MPSNAGRLAAAKKRLQKARKATRLTGPDMPCFSIVQRRISESGEIETTDTGRLLPPHKCSSACLRITLADLDCPDPKSAGFRSKLEEIAVDSVRGAWEKAQPWAVKWRETVRRACAFYGATFPAAEEEPQPASIPFGEPMQIPAREVLAVMKPAQGAPALLGTSAAPKAQPEQERAPKRAAVDTAPRCDCGHRLTSHAFDTHHGTQCTRCGLGPAEHGGGDVLIIGGRMPRGCPDYTPPSRTGHCMVIGCRCATFRGEAR